jgi:hypothetical protein
MSAHRRTIGTLADFYQRKRDLFLDLLEKLGGRLKPLPCAGTYLSDDGLHGHQRSNRTTRLPGS